MPPLSREAFGEQLGVSRETLERLTVHLDGGDIVRGLAMLALGEFFCWAMIGVLLGFAGHWWKSNADPYPDILDKDSPMLNIALTEHTVENYVLGHRYDVRASGNTTACAICSGTCPAESAAR